VTQDELKALIEEDEGDIIDILTTSVKAVDDDDAFVFAILQMQLLSRLIYWTTDVLAARMGGLGLRGHGVW